MWLLPQPLVKQYGYNECLLMLGNARTWDNSFFVITSQLFQCQNPMCHNRSRNIETRHHFIRELVTGGSINMAYCKTNDQLDDLFTKALPRDKLEYLGNMLGVVNFNIMGEC